MKKTITLLFVVYFTLMSQAQNVPFLGIDSSLRVIVDKHATLARMAKEKRVAQKAKAPKVTLAVYKTVTVGAGGLYSALTATERSKVTNLTIYGTIDARDFKTMRDDLTALSVVGISGVSIAAYTGTAGTSSGISRSYPANAIPEYAFYACGDLTFLTLPTSVTLISEKSFEFSGLTSINIPTSLKTIGDNAFFGCDLASINIPSTVTTIGEGAFASIIGPINVAVNNLNFSSQNGVLFDKNKTTLIQCPTSQTGSYTIPSTVTSIGDWAFFWCDNLTSISLPSAVTSLGVFSFTHTKISSINIPSSVVSINIDNCSFQDFSGLINVDANNPNYSSQDGVLFNKNKTLLIQCPITKAGNYSIPSSVNFINDNAFYYCSSLTSITIPSSVTSIGRYAFSSCTGLTSLTIPSSVSSIGGSALFACSNLKSINTLKTVPVDLSFISDVFWRVDKTTCVLNVPKGSKPAYQAAVQWKDFVLMSEMNITSVGDIEAFPLKVIVQNGQVLITGIPEGETLTIYTIQGKSIYNQKINVENATISLPTRDVYIVRFGNQSMKVVY